MRITARIQDKEGEVYHDRMKKNDLRTIKGPIHDLCLLKTLRDL